MRFINILLCLKKSTTKLKPGIEPGTVPYQGTILPLNYISRFIRYLYQPTTLLTAVAMSRGVNPTYPKRALFTKPRWVHKPHHGIEPCSFCITGAVRRH